jgi:hypothetical protein
LGVCAPGIPRPELWDLQMSIRVVSDPSGPGWGRQGQGFVTMQGQAEPHQYWRMVCWASWRSSKVIGQQAGRRPLARNLGR